jgi:hypothetical protein
VPQRFLESVLPVIGAHEQVIYAEPEKNDQGLPGIQPKSTVHTGHNAGTRKRALAGRQR